MNRNDPNRETAIPFAELPPATGAAGDERESAGRGKGHASPEEACSQIAFASLLPRLRDLFEGIHQPGDSLLDTLANNINELQDSFTQTLYAELAALNVDVSIKITLRLDKAVRLEMVGPHPDSAGIAAILREKEGLSTAFAEIAAQSAALRELRILSVLAGGMDASGSCAALAASPGENSYQISLKGDMNHFYFLRG